MSRLLMHGYLTTLTLGNTKGVDILVYNPENRKHFRVEVKTTGNKTEEDKTGLWGKKDKFYWWRMAKHHEEVKDADLIYAFVYLDLEQKSYKLFFLNAKDVGEYCKREHELYLKAPHKKEVQDSDMRSFRIYLSDESLRRDDFKLFQ